MNLDPDTLNGIKTALRLHPHGMSSADLSGQLGVPREVVEGHIDYLIHNGEVRVKSPGDAGVFILSQGILAPAILRFSCDMIVLLDAKRKVIQMNDAFQEFCGMEAASLVGQEITGLAEELTVDDLPFDDFLENPESQRPRTFLRFLNQDGKDRFFNVKMAPWSFEDGTWGVVMVIEDATARRNAELALAEAQHLFRDVLQNIQDVFYRTDMAGTLVMASDSFARMLGYDSIDECLGQNVETSFYVHPEQRAELIAQLQKDGTVWDYEVLLRKQDGTQLPVALNSHLYFGPDGTELGVEGIFRDISERKESQQCIHRHIERIVDLSKELLDIVDHPPRSREVMRARSECAIDRVHG